MALHSPQLGPRLTLLSKLLSKLQAGDEEEGRSGIRINLVKLPSVGVRPPSVGSEGNELIVQVRKDTGRSWGPSPFPVRSELIT